MLGRNTEKKPLLSTEDGWRFVTDHPQQHYFYKFRSLCGRYSKMPKDSHHDNNPLVHCTKCEQTIRKLMAISSTIVGRQLSARQVFNLLENFDSIKLNRGAGSLEAHIENNVAVITSQVTGLKTIVTNKAKKRIKK